MRSTWFSTATTLPWPSPATVLKGSVLLGRVVPPHQLVHGQCLKCLFCPSLKDVTTQSVMGFDPLPPLDSIYSYVRPERYSDHPSCFLLSWSVFSPLGAALLPDRSTVHQGKSPGHGLPSTCQRSNSGLHTCEHSSRICSRCWSSRSEAPCSKGVEEVWLAKQKHRYEHRI